MGGWEQARVWAAIGVATSVLLGGFWVGDMLVPSEYPGRMGYKVPDVTAPSVDLAALQRNWPRGLSEPGGDVRLVNYMAHIDRMAPAPATAGPAAPAEPVPDLGTLLARADPAKGKSKAQVCVSCHSFAPNGPNGIGPPLYGIVGHDIASHPGFAYSAPVWRARRRTFRGRRWRSRGSASRRTGRMCWPISAHWGATRPCRSRRNESSPAGGGF
jgi:cytochrome c